MAVPVKTFTLYVAMLARDDRTLRRLLDSLDDAIGRGTSSFGDVEDTLWLSPTLVGGVEEEEGAWITSGSSIVASLLTETMDSARVI